MAKELTSYSESLEKEAQPLRPTIASAHGMRSSPLPPSFPLVLISHYYRLGIAQRIADLGAAVKEKNPRKLIENARSAQKAVKDLLDSSKVSLLLLLFLLPLFFLSSCFSSIFHCLYRCDSRLTFSSVSFSSRSGVLGGVS